MTDRDHLVNEFNRLTAPEPPTPQHFEQSGTHNTQLNVTGNNNHVNANQDTLGKLIERARPWLRRWLTTFAVLTSLLVAFRLLQILAHQRATPYNLLPDAALAATWTTMLLIATAIAAPLFKRRS